MGRQKPIVNLKVFKMEEYGKIFVVVIVLAFILVGIFAYLFTIDRKLRKLEKEIEQKSAKNEK
jgi:CcmD family protein